MSDSQIQGMKMFPALASCAVLLLLGCRTPSPTRQDQRAKVSVKLTVEPAAFPFLPEPILTAIRPYQLPGEWLPSYLQPSSGTQVTCSFDDYSPAHRPTDGREAEAWGHYQNRWSSYLEGRRTTPPTHGASPIGELMEIR